MNDEIAISVEHVSKEFKVYLDKGYSLKERVLFKNRRKYEERHVLRDINFNVKKGEAIGLVGQNGCGKSTLLKLLSRIMYPDTGKVEVNGRVSALIELGAGFHPDMSGRENIYTNAAIFGLNKQEIDERLQTIIDFSELEDFIDNPVRTYSSGMYMRLAFSVAINVDADILLIDEILAVGDVGFQAKCFNKLREIKGRGTTIVIVSHSLSQIEQICDQSYWIENGLIKVSGKPYEVHHHYIQYMGTKNGITPTDNDLDDINTKKSGAVKNRWGSFDVIICGVSIKDKSGNSVLKLETGEYYTIEIKYMAKKKINDAIFGVGFFRNDGLQCYGVNTHLDHIDAFNLSDEGVVQFEVKYNSLLEGIYTIDVAIHRPDGFEYDYYKECKRIEVYSTVKDSGIMRIQHEWKFY